MKAELMHTVSDDGIRLDGAYFKASDPKPANSPVDAWVLIHGSGGRFAQPILLHFAQKLQEHGYPCLSINTAGHDSVWVGESGKPQGNAFEIIDRCRHDLRAAIDWLGERGHSRVGLLGRSLGAVKVGYYAAVEPDPRVNAVICASPVRLSHSYFATCESAEEFLNTYQAFQKLVDEGNPQELVHVRFPINNIFSAASYLDMYHPDERYNLMRLADRIRVPLLCLSGEREVHPRLIGLAREVSEAAVNSPATHWDEVDKADHTHAGRFEEASQFIIEWLEGLEAQANLQSTVGA
jgi:alpha/beta superfamily hydrolase